MIFKALDNNEKEFSKRMALNDKSFENIKRDFSSGQGLISSLFNNSINPKDIESIKQYTELLSQGVPTGKAWSQSMTGCSVAAKQQVLSCKNQISSLKGLIATTNASTTASKVGAIAIKGLAAAGNMLASWAFTKVITFIIDGIYKLRNASKICRENVDELMTSFNSSLDEANNTAKSVENLATRYETLSKGVNNLGEKVSLSTDEYKEYNDIVNQIAEMFPSLISGYTDEGTAILSLKGNVDKLRDSYKEAQQEAYNMLIVSGENVDGNDIIENFQNQVNGEETFWNKIKGKSVVGLKGSIDILDNFSNINDIGELQKRFAEIKDYTNVSGSEILKDALNKSGLSDFLYTNNYDRLNNEDLVKIKNKIKAVVQTYQFELSQELNNVQSLANAYLMTNEDYKKLDQQSQNVASIIINTIDEGIASGFEVKEDVGTYVISILDLLKNNKEAKETLLNLFTIDYSDMPIKEANTIIDKYLDDIAKVLNTNKVDLKIRFGFDHYDSLYEDYQNSLTNAAYKFTGTSEELLNYGGVRYTVNSQYDILDRFAQENSINTEEEIAFWNQCVQESQTRKQAMDKYLSAQSNTSTYLSDLHQTKIDEYHNKLNVLKSAYNDIENIDSQTLSKLMSTFNDYDWDQVGKTKSLQTALEEIANISFKEVSDSLNDLPKDNILLGTLKEAANLTNEFDPLINRINETRNSLENLDSIIYNINNNQNLSSSEIENLLTLYPQLNDYIIKTSNGYTIEASALKDIREQIYLTESAQIDAQINQTEAAISNTKDRLTAYEEEILALNNLKIASEYGLDDLDIPDDLERQLHLLNNVTKINKTKLNELESDLQKKKNQKKYLDISYNNNNNKEGRDKNSGSGSTTTNTKDFYQTINWIEKRYQSLEDEVASLNTELSKTQGFEDQITAIENLKNKLDELFTAYSDGEKHYNQLYENKLSELNKLGVDSNYYDSLIKEGTINIEDFIDTNIAADQTGLREKVHKIVNEAIDFYDKSKDSSKKKIQTEMEIKAKIKEKLDIQLAEFDGNLSVLNNDKQDILNSIEESKVLGKEATEKQYNDLIDINKQEIEKYFEKISKLNDYKNNNNIAVDSKEYVDLQNNIQDCENSISALNKEQLEYNKSIFKMPIIQYEKENEQYKKTLDQLADQRKKVESGIGYANHLIQDQIDLLNQSKTSIEEHWDERIKSKQEEKNLLTENNDELKRQLDLENALYNLDKAKNQKVNRIYKEGIGFVYEADQDSINDATKVLDDVNFNNTIANLDKELNSLEKQKNSSLKAIDDQIEEWQKYADQLNKILASYDLMISKQDLISVFGEKAINSVLNKDTGILGIFETNLNGIKTNETFYQEQIEANQKLIDKINEDADNFVERAADIVEAQNNIAEAIKNNGEEITAIDDRTKAVQDLGRNWTETKDDTINSLSLLSEAEIVTKDIEKAIFDERANNLLIFRDITVSILNEISQALLKAESAYTSLLAILDKTNEATNLGTNNDETTIITKPLKKLHTGGIVNNSITTSSNKLPNQVMALVTEPLSPNETITKLLNDEVVLNRTLQSNLVGNFVGLGSTIYGYDTLNNLVTSKAGTQNTNINVQKLELPNVRTSDDAQKIVDALKNLGNIANQQNYI